MTTTNILICLLAVAISGIPGYILSFRFWRSHYAATNTSGDFGAPRGGFFALMAGMFVGMIVFSLLGRFNLIASDAVGIGMITSMIAGAIGGFIGGARGKNSRNDNGNPPTK